MNVVETVKEIDRFAIRIGRATFEGRLGGNGRWYVHRKVSGRITDAGSYASRRSARRAIFDRVGRETV